jgi:hypothetical protein
VEVTSTEEETQHAEQDFYVSHTAFSFHQLQLPDEKSNYSFLIHIRNISEYLFIQHHKNKDISRMAEMTGRPNNTSLNHIL